MSVKSSLAPEVKEEQIVFVAQEQLPNGEVPVAIKSNIEIKFISGTTVREFIFK